MNHEFSWYVLNLLEKLAGLDAQLVLLMTLIVVAVIVIDAISLSARHKRKEIGMSRKAGTVSIDGSKALPIRNYVSEMQGLAGKPDALISEGGYIIPVERKPLARKIRDRYVAQILVYMRLIEEFEGRKPPYGYLILGANCRRVKIENSEERQAWLQKLLDEMRAVLERGAAVVPAPQLQKCSKCDVRSACAYKLSAPERA